MNLLDRYLYAVSKYLPKDIAEDVSKELRTNIEDMLPESYTEDDVYTVLEELGSPLELANMYNPQKKYLIGPGYYDKYLSILKLVVGICITVSIGIAIIVSIIDSVNMGLIDVIVLFFKNIISGAFSGIIQGAFWVTLIFIVLERSGVEMGTSPFNKKAWTPDLLPEIPTNELKISKGETIFSIIFTIIFITLLYFNPRLIAVYSETEVVPLFNLERLNFYMIFILALALLQLGLFIWKFLEERWNLPLIICHTIHNVLNSILAVLMLSDKSLFNIGFISKISELTKVSFDTISIWFERSKLFFAIFFVIILIGNSIAIYYKHWSRKSKI
jgi:hypothetical protein